MKRIGRGVARNVAKASVKNDNCMVLIVVMISLLLLFVCIVNALAR
jgi:hypothetical protein